MTHEVIAVIRIIVDNPQAERPVHDAAERLGQAVTESDLGIQIEWLDCFGEGPLGSLFYPEKD